MGEQGWVFLFCRLMPEPFFRSPRGNPVEPTIEVSSFRQTLTAVGMHSYVAGDETWRSVKATGL